MRLPWRALPALLLWGCSGADQVDPIRIHGDEPAAAILFPHDGDRFDAHIPLVLEGRGVDLQEPETPVEYRWESGRDGLLAEGVAEEGGRIHAELEGLSAGSHSLMLRVRNHEGYVGTAQVEVQVATAQAPLVTLSGPEEDWPTDLPVPLEGRVRDGDARRPGWVVLKIKGGAFLPRVAVDEEGGFSAQIPRLAEGSYLIEARVTDLEGHESVDGVVIRVVECPDQDGDGIRACQGDCDDGEDGVHPGMPVQPGDGIDQDCEGGDEPPFALEESGVFLPSPLAESDFGAAVLSSPDLDGDGLPELVVGAPAASTEWTAASGAVFIYSGESLLQFTADISLPPTPVVLTGLASEDAAGSRVQSLADVDGDGASDLVIASPEYASSAGRLHVYSGGRAMEEAGEHSLSESLARIDGEYDQDGLGRLFLWTADLDGDGWDEIGASARISPATPEESQTPLGLGGSTGCLVFRGTDVAPGAALTASNAATAAPDAEGEDIAFSAPVGDLNGDGRPELLVGAPYGGANRGEVYVFSGADLMSRSLSKRQDAQLVLLGAYDGATLGTSAGEAGDVDGDGWGDFAVGGTSALGGAGHPGGVYLIPGAAVVAGGVFPVMDLALAWFLGEEWPDEGGVLPPVLPDLDGDGVADLLTGAPAWSETADSTGRVYVVTGARYTSVSELFLASPSARLSGTDSLDRLGEAGSLEVGDWDGDGLHDLLLGCPSCGVESDTGSGEGVWLIASPWRED